MGLTYILSPSPQKRKHLKEIGTSVRLNQSINQSINPSIHQSINPSIHQSINPSIHQSINPSIHQSINPSSHPAIQPSSHPAIKKSRNQEIKKSRNQEIKKSRNQEICFPSGRPIYRFLIENLTWIRPTKFSCKGGSTPGILLRMAIFRYIVINSFIYTMYSIIFLKYGYKPNRLESH